ncbi:MAG TPA: DUF3368 domain-containing protein, partial [Candidatus Eremiobacteraeota bacterium]|nr:DUF3368 domain-containing protein [Candidatus Eremiobacteraeota bacterium]
MPYKMTVICNSTVIISLSSIGYIDILQKLYEEIIIAQEVYNELKKGQDKPGSDIEQIEWIKVKSISEPKLKEYLGINLDKGEAETIALGEEIKSDLLLLDDYWGRKFAEYRNLKISGTLGVIIRAKSEGIIEQVKPLRSPGKAHELIRGIVYGAGES